MPACALTACLGTYLRTFANRRRTTCSPEVLKFGILWFAKVLLENQAEGGCGAHEHRTFARYVSLGNSAGEVGVCFFPVSRSMYFVVVVSQPPLDLADDRKAVSSRFDGSLADSRQIMVAYPG